MIALKRTDSSDPAFIDLVRHLDSELAIVDGKDHTFYSQFNKIDKIRHVVVAYDDDEPVGCGAIKEFAENIMEVKRMFVSPEKRNKGIASLILAGLEKWALELGCHSSILETGLRQPDAIRLYTRNGYRQIPNYGQYTGVANSVCYKKELR
jgi:putative acetyltransferase